MFANARKHALYYSLRGVLLDLVELVFSTGDVNETLTKCLLLVMITSGADLKTCSHGNQHPNQDPPQMLLINGGSIDDLSPLRV